MGATVERLETGNLLDRKNRHGGASGQVTPINHSPVFAIGQSQYGVARSMKVSIVQKMQSRHWHGPTPPSETGVEVGVVA
ncbi:MAG: hypothetical protein EHM23_10760 [Acidobacteria bacterium]|nr:MAG: hypothetical protein EHM23_10760 [Acidobacteriota bacterium]